MPEKLPSVFIGASTVGLDVAREVELQLQHDAITTIWKDGVFGLGSVTFHLLPVSDSPTQPSAISHPSFDIYLFLVSASPLHRLSVPLLSFFFSGLSAEKKTYLSSANFAALAKRAVKNLF